MYNENSNFQTKNIIVQFLFVALIVFVLIWLFPLKSDLKNLKTASNGDDSNLTVLVDRIFNENIIAMKDSAKSYYTLERLPKNVGDKVKMTLGEMLEKKIILPFTDKHGKTCDMTASYVEVTKYDTEYLMKVNLKCGDEENYLLVYMGCYDYCSTTVCEKNRTDVKSPVIYSKKTETKITNNPTPQPAPSKEYIYEYVKTTQGFYTETDWSTWSGVKVTADANTAVQTKEVTSKKLIGYNVTRDYDYTKPIYGTKTVATGDTKTVKYCAKYDYVKTGEYSYGDWQYVETVYLSYTPNNTDTVQYISVGENSTVCEGNCTATTTKAYKKYVKSATPITKYECVEYGTKTEPVTTTVKTITGYETKIVSKTPVYKETKSTLYRYKTRTYHPGTTDVKWSVYNDTTLLSSGYNYTGNKKVK
ncbi:MAG: hypothetical protein IJ715_02970 [Bacilli bacterium]|nr:hypothetical protein [Bacilli bacterium]